MIVFLFSFPRPFKCEGKGLSTNKDVDLRPTAGTVITSAVSVQSIFTKFNFQDCFFSQKKTACHSRAGKTAVSEESSFD